MSRVPAADVDADRQDEIVAAARACFRRWGIARTRMDDIAEAVGIARPNLYRYFPSKDSLVKRVTVDEARRINEARQASIAIRGPVAPIISRSIIDGIAMARADDYLAELMTHENVALAARALAHHGPDDVRMEYWRPILAHGRARGELRAELTDEQIVHWLGVVQMLFLENQELYPDLAAVAEHVDGFVVPSLLACPAPRGGTRARPQR